MSGHVPVWMQILVTILAFGLGNTASGRLVFTLWVDRCKVQGSLLRSVVHHAASSGASSAAVAVLLSQNTSRADAVQTAIVAAQSLIDAIATAPTTESDDEDRCAYKCQIYTSLASCGSARQLIDLPNFMRMKSHMHRKMPAHSIKLMRKGPERSLKFKIVPMLINDSAVANDLGKGRSAPETVPARNHLYRAIWNLVTA